MLSYAKTRSDTVEIDQKWIIEKILSGKCEATGLPFDLSGPDENSCPRSFSPSLDRIDREKGYTKENTQVVCWIYNRAKGVDSHDAVVTLAEALCKKTG